MIRQLYSSLLLLACLSIAPRIHAQVLDLIVTKEGDSIACRIDSITSSKIHFEMKNKGRWINTETGLDRISVYERGAVNRQEYYFKPGTSTIESAYVNQLQKNSVYLGLGSLCYGRTFPGNQVSVTVAAGLGWPDGLGVYLESTVLFGKNKHYFEMGLSSPFLPDDGGIEALGIIIRCGYRYQGPRGFLFRSAPTLGFVDGDIIPLPALSFGYSF